MTTTVDELTRWLQTPKEGAHLEFKEASNQYDFEKVLRYSVAFANEDGGKLILGVTDRLPRTIVGSSAFPDPGALQTRIFNKLRFRVDIEELILPEGRVLIFHIPPRPRGTAYNIDGAYLMRSADQLVAMSEDRLRAIFAEGKPDWLSEVAQSNVAGQDVITLLDTQSYFDLLNIPYPSTREAVLDRLQREKLILDCDGEWNISNLGAILFAKKLEDFDSVRRKAARVIVYDGIGKLITRIDRVWSKGYAVGFEGLIDFISSQMPMNEVIGTALRTEIKMFPETAIRELVANALIHQDFSETGTSVVVEIYSDRMEISNPGKPFIEPARFIDEYQSRNENLADLMRRLHICEEKGSGIDRVIESAEFFQLPPPDFRATERRTIVALFAHTDFSKMNGSDRVRACYQHCCLRYVMNQRMTNQSLRERFHLTEAKAETVSRIIRETSQAGQIKLEDPSNASKRYAKYIPFWA
jgi:ATP-dependent DNA helicase RecG